MPAMTEEPAAGTSFVLELELPAAEWPRFRRRTLATGSARPVGRSHAVHLSWYDSATASLAQTGRSLSRDHAPVAPWRLERSRPDGEFWPPGRPAPILGVAGDPLALGIPVGEQLAELARLNGRVWSFALDGRDGDAAIRVAIRALLGEIACLEQSQSHCRISLSGPEEAVASQALAWAEEFPLAVPRASLGEAAVALASNRAALPRRLGSVALADGLSAGDSFARIVAHLTDVMLHWSDAIGTGGDDPEPVHQMRVALRRMRSAFSIFRPAVSVPATALVEAELRDLARALGPARDWDVFLAGAGARVSAAFPQEASLAHLIAMGTRRRDEAYRTLAGLRRAAAFRQLGIRLALLAGSTAWRAELSDEQRAVLDAPLREFAAEVLTRRHRRVRRAGRRFAALDAPALHVLRLAGKRLRYAAEFFSGLFAQEEARRFITRLTRLQDGLGLINDGDVAAGLMQDLATVPDTGADNSSEGVQDLAIGLVLGFVAGETGAKRSDLRHCWKRFRRLDAFWE